MDSKPICLIIFINYRKLSANIYEYGIMLDIMVEYNEVKYKVRAFKKLLSPGFKKQP